jgi:hypothetical protein
MFAFDGRIWIAATDVRAWLGVTTKTGPAK